LRRPLLASRIGRIPWGTGAAPGRRRVVLLARERLCQHLVELYDLICPDLRFLKRQRFPALLLVYPLELFDRFFAEFHINRILTVCVRVTTGNCA
jgi:hypothetical protein